MKRAPAAVVVLFAWAIGCQPQLVPPPTEAQARDFLSRVVDLAEAGDFEALCAMGGGNCDRILDMAGRDVPSISPTVVGTRIHEPTPSRHGAVILEICGVYDSGEPYYSEMAVSRNGDELTGIEPIYWSGFGIADDATVGEENAPVNGALDCGARPRGV